MYYAEYDSPVGVLLLTSDGEALTGLWMDRQMPEITEEPPVLAAAKGWLDHYFLGQAREIGFLLNPDGTDFQKMIWKMLLEIPFGETRSYGSLAQDAAKRMGREKMSAQAVGGAVGRNPISILIPCHRVIGASGALTGYAGGLEKKKWLLTHEGWREEKGK